jgi:hypothetical protein
MDKGKRKDRTLRGIATVLIALAVLAERVSCRSWPVRFLTLFILRPVEAYAWAYVAGMTGNLPPILDCEPEGGSGPENALELALRFRLLAAILQQLFRMECRLDRWSGQMDEMIAPPTGFDIARTTAHSGWTPSIIDTS